MNDTLTGAEQGSLSRALNFDHVIWVGADRKLDEHPHEHPYAPDVLDPDVNSTAIDGYPNWELITAGLTGQYGYDGPWLHDSELIEGAVARRVLEHAAEHDGGFYVAVYATYTCDECESAGLVWNDDATEELPCPNITTGECEPGGTIEGWAIAYWTGETK